MKKIGIVIVIVIIGALGFTQLKLSNQEKIKVEENLTQEVFKNEAEVFIKAKEIIPDDIDEDLKEKISEAEIELNAAQDAKEAAQATDKFYEIIVDLDIDEGIFAPIEESYEKAVIGRNNFNDKVDDNVKI